MSPTIGSAVAARRLDLLGGRVDRARQAGVRLRRLRDQGDVRALASEAQRDREADAAAAAGHDHGAVGELAHRARSLWVSGVRGCASDVSEANRETIKRFYAAFDAHDGETMAACYAPDVHFSDPVFPDLNGDEAGDMWRMLTGRAEDLAVELASHDADEASGTANWIAHLHLPHRAQGRQRHRRDVHVRRRRPDHRPPRQLRLLEVDPDGAGADRDRARLVADRPGQGALGGRRRPRGVPRRSGCA